MDNSGQDSEESRKMQEYWHNLQMESFRKCPPEIYRDYVLCDPIPKEDQAHMDSIREEMRKLSRERIDTAPFTVRPMSSNIPGYEERIKEHCKRIQRAYHDFRE